MRWLKKIGLKVWYSFLSLMGAVFIVGALLGAGGLLFIVSGLFILAIIAILLYYSFTEGDPPPGGPHQKG